MQPIWNKAKVQAQEAKSKVDQVQCNLVCLKDVSYVATCPVFFFAANSLSEVLRNRLLGKRLVQKAPILGSKKWTLEWGPLLGFHLNSYCKPETASILGSFFGTPKWEPLFGSIFYF